MTDCSSILRLGTAAALIISTLPAQTARAESCTYDPFFDYNNDPNYADTSDQAQNDADRWFNAFHCAQGSSPTHGTIGRFYWDKFGFVKDYWDEGFGWDNICDDRMPASRALSSMYILQNSYTPATGDWADRTGPTIRWAFGYSALAYSTMDDLRAGCFADKPTVVARTTQTPIDDYFTLFLPFFVNQNVVGRASTLFHEALHYRGGMSHTCNDSQDSTFFVDTFTQVACTPLPSICQPCGRGAGCNCVPDTSNGCVCSGGRGVTSCTRRVLNPNPSHPSVYAYQILWFASYAFDANASTNPTMKNWARYEARARVSSKFCDPGSIPAWVRGV